MKIEKTLIITVLILFSINSYSQTQSEMNQEAYTKLDKSDKELNKVYKLILDEYKTDTIFIENLKKSQNIWIKFRDAELDMKYPKRQRGYYGSVYPLCRASYLENLTKKRTKTLKIWLNGIEEGDVCIGSVKLKKRNRTTFNYKSQIPDSLVLESGNVITGDFNGNNKIDFAGIVRNKTNNKRGIIIIHNSENSESYVFGAGKKVSKMIDLNWIEVFETIPKGEIVSPTLVDKETGDIIGQDESKNFKLIGNGIYMSVEESQGGGIIFWNGKEYQWYHIE